MLFNQNPGATFENIYFNVHNKSHFIRSTLEGIAFAFAHGIDLMKDLGLSVELMKAGNDNLFQSAIFSQTLANLISGVSIVADAPYKIGDYIVLDTGERGIVTGLGIRSTRLLTRDDVEISIPNAVIGNAKITNESGGPWVLHRIRIPVGVAYGSDTELVVKLLEQVASDNSAKTTSPFHSRSTIST